MFVELIAFKRDVAMIASFPYTFRKPRDVTPISICEVRL